MLAKQSCTASKNKTKIIALAKCITEAVKGEIKSKTFNIYLVLQILDSWIQLWVPIHMRVCEQASERESLCVCVCVHVRHCAYIMYVRGKTHIYYIYMYIMIYVHVSKSVMWFRDKEYLQAKHCILCLQMMHYSYPHFLTLLKELHGFYMLLCVMKS